MTISIPLVAIVGVFVLVAWQSMGSQPGRRSCACSPGSLLAATSAAPVLHRLITAVVRALTGH